MKPAKKIWMDGKFVPWKAANVHVLTHTLHYGGGAFEGIRFYDTKEGPAIFRLKEHMDRLFFSTKCLHMDVPFTKKQLTDATLSLLKVNKLKSGYIRPLVYFGYGKMGLDPRGAPIKVSISAWAWGSYLGEHPVKIKVSKYMRIHSASTEPEAKLCGNYVNSILASLDVHNKKYDEAYLLDVKGNVAEGPGENMFIVKQGRLITPKLGSILPGITRDCVITVAKTLGIPVTEKVVTQKQLYTADEAFFTGTAAEVTPIGYIDDKKINGGKMGPITAQLKSTFHNAVTGKDSRFKKWLTIVK